MKMLLWWISIVSVVVAGFSNLSIYVEGFENSNKSLLHVQSQNESMARAHRQVDLTIIKSAVAKGAVCLDGSPPAYYLDRGFGVGYNSWVIDLEGGAWCHDIKTCVSRKKNAHGSSKYMNKQKSFNGLLSSKPAENPDFYNWNKVRVNYCDGASFSGNSEDKAAKLQFRGQRIWSAVMEDLMSKGMRDADEALLTGCSAGGLASILHCDEFRALFNKTTKVKCLSDAGLFLDVEDVSGEHSVRDVFSGVIGMQDVKAPCTCHLDPLSCFFPQNLINNVITPLFILNSAYDAYQIGHGLAPASADPKGKWNGCKKNHKKCTASQIQAIQEFRSQMLKVVEKFSSSKKNGLFINSCFSHCQSELPNTWLADDSPVIGNKAIATAVGDWYFDRALVDAIGRPYPYDKTCQNII